MPEEYFFYNSKGLPTHCEDTDCVVVSKIKLPQPTKAKRFLGKCCIRKDRIPWHMRKGTRINVAFGDPVILRECKFQGVINYTGKMPSAVRGAFVGNYYILLLEYKGAPVWVLYTHACLLEKLGEPDEE